MWLFDLTTKTLHSRCTNKLMSYFFYFAALDTLFQCVGAGAKMALWTAKVADPCTGVKI